MTEPDTSTHEDEYRAVLANDPGNEIFVPYTDFLRRSGRTAEALLVSARGVAASPDLSRGQLALARVYFEAGCLSFAAREVEMLVERFPSGKFLRKLLARLSPNHPMISGPGAASPAGTEVATVSETGATEKERVDREVVAEAEIDLDVFEADPPKS
jgi:hypothetical protein